MIAGKTKSDRLTPKEKRTNEEIDDPYARHDVRARHHRRVCPGKGRRHEEGRRKEGRQEKGWQEEDRRAQERRGQVVFPLVAGSRVARVRLRGNPVFPFASVQSHSSP